MERVTPLDGKTPEQEEMEIYERAADEFGPQGAGNLVKDTCICLLETLVGYDPNDSADVQDIKYWMGHTFVALSVLEVALGGVAYEEEEALRTLRKTLSESLNGQ
jgi:hypothetical protein